MLINKTSKKHAKHFDYFLNVSGHISTTCLIGVLPGTRTITSERATFHQVSQVSKYARKLVWKEESYSNITPMSLKMQKKRRGGLPFPYSSEVGTPRKGKNTDEKSDLYFALHSNTGRSHLQAAISKRCDQVCKRLSI